MARTDADPDPAPEKPRKSRKLLGVLAMILGASALGGGGFYAAHSGMIPELGPGARNAAPKGDTTSFIAIEPVTVSLSPDASVRYLRFGAQLEIDPAAQAEITRLTPRIIDVLNIYLRAVDPADLAEPAMMTRMRAQILRRIRIVTGGERVRDLLITEFVLS